MMHIARQLKQWFYLHKRDLPWRNNPSPYAVMVSEVMLQQTQVSVVIPYFKKWMQKFSSIEALASSPIEEVIKMWEGLGYYSRARNLHTGAQYLLEIHKGNIPSSYQELSKVKGLGPYTIGAILNFAYRKKIPAIDGNVQRVISRLYAVKEEMSTSQTKKQIYTLVEQLLPDEEPWIVSEALIELGALVCKKKPDCVRCPLKESCLVFKYGIAETLPIKTKKVKISDLHRLVLIIYSGEGVFVHQGKKGKVMEGLWEFPYIELSKGPKLPKVVHRFTRYRASLYSYRLKIRKPRAHPTYIWKTWAEVEGLPFSSGHRELLKNFSLNIASS